VIGRAELAGDERFNSSPARKANEDELDRTIAAWCAERDRWEITRLLQAEGVIAFPVLDSKDLAEDPHLNARRVFTRFEHGEVGVRTLMGVPWRFAHTSNGGGSAAPLLGQDTEYVLEHVLGCDKGERERLYREKIVE
jgi:crotonobetainyl-CoA:carnitine CoA-transferase CaiB-like acyl-CoA transferase